MKLKCRAIKTAPSEGGAYEEVCVTIEDKMSGVQIASLSFAMEDFGKLVVTNGYTDVEVEVVGYQGFRNLGKNREVMRIAVPRKTLISHMCGDKSKMREEVDRLFSEHHNNLIDDGWSIWNDGTGSKQHGSEHGLSVHRYVSAKATGDGGKV